MRILVVEDEAVVAQRLVRMLKSILGEQARSVRHYEDFYDALNHVRQNPIDLLFLDLNLNGKNGFEILSEAAAGTFQTIVVSAHQEQAIGAFEYGVVDFVPKPFTEVRLRKALDRYRERGASPSTKFVAIREGHRVEAIPVAEIVYIKGADDYSEIHCQDGTVHLHERSLSGLQHVLPAQFLRVHRSFIVNLGFAAALENPPGLRCLLILRNGEALPVSRTRASAVRAHFRNEP